MARPLREVLEEPQVLRGLTQDPASFRFRNGALVTVAAVQWQPYITVGADADGCRVVSGPMGSILAVLAHTLNFTCNVVSPPDNVWGVEQPNGTWTGMMGQVIRKEADLALGPFGMTYDRKRVVDFTTFYSFDARAILSRKGTSEIDPWGFMYPLTGSVWLAVATSLTVVWLAMMLLCRRPDGAVSVNWAGEVFLQNVRVFLNQGLTNVVLGHGGLMILGSWMVVAALVFWTYAGTLISLLAVRYIPQPIQTLRDLLNDHTLTVITVPMTFFSESISKMKSGELRELHDLQYVGRVKYETLDLHNMIEKFVRHGGYSIIDASFTLDLSIAEDFLKTKRCDFYKTGYINFSTGSYMILQKGSPVVQAIDHRVRSIMESGLFEHWLQNEIQGFSMCSFSPSIILVTEPLSFANLWGMFVVLGVGLLVAAGVLCLEFCFPPTTASRP